ncbi:GNAT family N-acetyltransferase [Gudongella sp. SC589]|jgi:ribosomal protein S18 acetylase RimI-like enzyme|uniref:GNAT family N-acetyltransferase n=1 Tax=Gudongella sp. SC589 TaxID=3385990 RepID=UPI0039049156
MEVFHFKASKGMDRDLYEAVSELENICRDHDDVRLKLELDYKLAKADTPDENSDEKLDDFTCWDGHRLVGYLGIDDFGGRTVEVNGMVHPEYRRRGIFRELFRQAKMEWEGRDSNEMLLLTDRKSKEGKSFINGTGAAYDHTEYEMILSDGLFEEAKGFSKDLVLKEATNDDAREIARQNSIYFNEELADQELLDIDLEKKRGFHVYMAVVQGNIVGKVHLHLTNGEGGIFGLGIIPEWRGTGFGRELLLRSVHKLKELGASYIFLQVDAKNDTALGLYRSCGFKESYSMEYYKLNKER